MYCTDVPCHDREALAKRSHKSTQVLNLRSVWPQLAPTCIYRAQISAQVNARFSPFGQEGKSFASLLKKHMNNAIFYETCVIFACGRFVTIRKLNISPQKSACVDLRIRLARA
jgi:hypothetical protein